jgi:hypothetical protein
MASVLCQDCGTPNSQATKFCIECGTQMAAPPKRRAQRSPALAAGSERTTILCRACGSSNSQTTKFCIECGSQLGAPAQPPPPLLPAFATDSDVARFFLEQTGTRAVWRSIAIGFLIFAFAFAGYFLSTRVHPDGASVRWLDPPPRCCMFYADLANALNHGTLDLSEVGVAPNHPDLFTDADGEVFLPYQPMPGVLLMPFVAIWGTGLTQLTFSMMLGAVNVVLFWYILRLLNVSRQTKLLLIPFFAFGTAHFYSATTGSLWFYNHVAAVFFVLLGIVFLLRRDNVVLPALCLGAAALSRQPTVLAAPAFIYFMIEQRNPGVLGGIHPGEMVAGLVQLQFSRLRELWQRAWDSVREAARQPQVRSSVAILLATLIPFGIISLWYNDVRFGSLFDTGLDEIYDKYEGYGYTQYLAAGGDRFAQFSFWNVPIHLYTIFLQPPIFALDGTTQSAVFRPSEFGMSVLLTSSPLVFAFFVRRRDPLKIACWLAVALVSIPTLMYYSAGWVQFGYRYIMDYLPFLMILTAFGFEDNQSPRAFRIKVALVVLSIVVGFWGRYWATRLVW